MKRWTMSGALAIFIFTASMGVLVYCIHLSANADIAQHTSALMSMVIGSLITQTMVVVNHFFPSRSGDGSGSQRTERPKHSHTTPSPNPDN